MSKENSLSQIIREVTEHAKPIPGKEEVVTIDVRTAQAVDQPGFFGAMTGEFRYFLVSNNLNSHKIIKGVKRVKYREEQHEIVLTIAYEGGCHPGQERRLAQCYFESLLSEAAINDSLAGWLIEYFSSGTLTIDDFYAESANAAIALATKASHKFGLDLKIALGLEGTDTVDTIELGPVLISSRLKHSEAEESIWFKAELEVDQQRLLRALLSKNKPLTEILKKGVRRYLADHITLENFYKDLNTEQVKHGLSSHLNNLLKPLGRTVGFLSLKPADYDSHPQPFKGDTVIEFNHHEYPDPIQIKVSVLMMPTNPTRYKAGGSPKLSAWLDNSLREVITLALFGISYVDLLLDFAELKRKIDDSMNERAEAIGYHIEQLMTILYLEPFDWLRRIDIEIKGAAPNNGQITEAMFETSLSNFYVGLEIILTARIRDLLGISDYLNTKPEVPQRMKEEIIRLVRRFMHGTDPERFYMRYSQTDPIAYPDEIPFEAELRQKIHSLLETEFNADVIDLVLKPMQTELTRKLDEISKGAHDFAVEAELGSLPGTPMIIVKGSFKVDGVSGWQAFKQCDVSVEAVQKRIGDSVRARLKGVGEEQLNFSEQTGINKLLENVLMAARELVSNEFGLVISLKTIHWDWDDELKRIARLQRKNELTSVQERIQKLNELLLDLYENDASPDDIKNVQEIIGRLGATLRPTLASSVGIQQLGETKTAKSLSSQDSEQRDL